MTEKLPLKLITFLVMFAIISSSVSCGGGFSTGPQNLPGQLVVNISQAKTDAERQTAIQKVLCNSFSLGFVDENGNQLNPNVQDGSTSLTANDLAALSYFISEAQGYTINDIVDFLAAAGILLSSTKEAITTDGILPDIQKYVDWSYVHRDDTRSLLGLVLASGPDMQVVGASPKFGGDTRISTAAGLMMLADILAGVTENKQVVAKHSRNIANAAETDIQEFVLKAQGLITKIETGSEFKSLWDKIAVKKAAQGQTAQIKVPDAIKTMVAAFAAGNQFAVRLELWKSLDERYVVKSVELLKTPITFDRSLGAPLFLAPMLTLVPSGSVVMNVPTTFSLNLLSYGSSIIDQSAPLFPDADAIFLSDQMWSQTRIELGGHRLGIIQTGGKSSGFTISIKNCSNTERRIALLHVSAKINVPDVAELMVENLQYVKLLQLKAEDILDMYSVMEKAIQVTPWVCEVAIPPVTNKVKITPAEFTGETGKEYEFHIEGDSPPVGCKYQWMVKGDALPSWELQEEHGVLKYIFQKEGTYTLSLTIVDSNFKTWAEASSSKVTIKATTTPNVTLDIIPPPLLETMQTLIFKVKPSTAPELIPENTAWKWDFGDDSQPVTKVGRIEADLVCGHNYYKNGSFNVKVSLVDKTSGQVLATTTESIVVDDSASIRKTNIFKIGLRVYGTEEYGLVTSGVYRKQGTQDTHIVGGATFPREYTTSDLQQTYVWKDGGRFEATWINVATSWRGIQTTIINVQGHIAVTPDGIQLYSCTYNYSMSFPNYEGKGVEWKVTERWELKDILLTKNAWGEKPEYKFRLEGKGIAQHIVTVASEEYSPNGSRYIFLTPQWDNLPSGDPPYIEVIFSTIQ